MSSPTRVTRRGEVCRKGIEAKGSRFSIYQGRDNQACAAGRA